MIDRWSAVVVAAGRGTRFGRPKQLVPIAGIPMLQWSLRVFTSMSEVTETVVVTEAEWLEEVEQIARGCRVVPGGATRQASVHAGLRALQSREGGVLVHDGARPFITAALVRAGMEAVSGGTAALLAVPVVDTIKVVDAGCVSGTLERGTLWAAQTPQFAATADMLRAHEEGIRDGVDATDDAMLLERAGVTVRVVPGSPENFKVTLPEDLVRAEQLAIGRA